MSYSVYSTRGFILGSAPSGEAGKTYVIYTEQFGLVRAHAQGVRHLKSKLRYNLADYSLATFSLVRGKEFWRITGAVAEVAAPWGEGTGSETGARQARARILSFVRRLVQGEERNDELFSALLDLFVPILGDSPVDPIAFETDMLARCLSTLGYIDLATLEGLDQRAKIAAINKSLRESQL